MNLSRRRFLGLGPAMPAAAVTASLTITQQGHAPITLDASVLRLQTGDVIVLSCPRQISNEAARRIRDSLGEILPRVKVILLSGEMKIDGVIRP